MKPTSAYVVVLSLSVASTFALPVFGRVPHKFIRSNAPSDIEAWTIDAARSDLGRSSTGGPQAPIIDTMAWEVDVWASCSMDLYLILLTQYAGGYVNIQY